MSDRVSVGAGLRSVLSAGVAGPTAGMSHAQAGTAPAAPGEAIVINALGTLDNLNLRLEPATGGARRRRCLDARALKDAHASGLTAINWTLGYVGGGGEPFEDTISDVALFDRMIRDQSADILKVLSVADILRAKREGKIGVIYGFQNAAMVGDKPERVDIFADLGVRVIQLTYNPTNQIGDGSAAPANRGLTPFGREIVARLNDNRVMVDLSHSGQATCLEAARVSSQPVSINHTGCRALVDLPRNKTDEELRLVADRGGFVGIYFMPFLSLKREVTGDDIVAHIEHALQVCGEDHVGIGTDGQITPADDLDAFRVDLAKEVEARRKAGIAATGEAPHLLFAVDLRGVDQFRDLGARLRKRGHSSNRVDKILGGNFLRYAAEVWAK